MEVRTAEIENGLYEIDDNGIMVALSIERTVHQYSCKPSDRKYGAKVLKPYRIKNTWYYNLERCTPRKRVAIHRVVAQQFLDNPTHRIRVGFIGSDRSQYGVENLKWL